MLGFEEKLKYPEGGEEGREEKLLPTAIRYYGWFWGDSATVPV